ncbi:MAG: hypothetical protein K2R98_02765 [Gemmataceae bacterium]|nr:hypothetical protein [Gemmataceae bacterium]
MGIGTIALVAFTLVGAPSESGADNDPPFPLPLYHDKPVISPRYEFRLLPTAGYGPFYTFPLVECETWRLDWFLDAVTPHPLHRSTRQCAGLSSEWYLGRGISVSLNAEAKLFGLRAPVKLHWYPLEGSSVILGWDLLNGQPFLDVRHSL